MPLAIIFGSNQEHILDQVENSDSVAHGGQQAGAVGGEEQISLAINGPQKIGELEVRLHFPASVSCPKRNRIASHRPSPEQFFEAFLRARNDKHELIRAGQAASPTGASAVRGLCLPGLEPDSRLPFARFGRCTTRSTQTDCCSAVQGQTDSSLLLLIPGPPPTKPASGSLSPSFASPSNSPFLSACLPCLPLFSTALVLLLCHPILRTQPAL
jgi:hypothetical protein